MKPETKPRRGFLKDATCAVAAATGVAGVASRVFADPAAESTVDDVHSLELGLRPVLGSFGAVVIPRNPLVFVTFPASGDSGDGIAVVQLTGCVAWKSSGSSAGAVDANSLEPCGTYEVCNSSWAEATRAAASAEGSAPLRHFIFTFMGLHEQIDNCGTHFECLAEALLAEWLPSGPFSDVVDYADFLNANV